MLYKDRLICNKYAREMEAPVPVTKAEQAVWGNDGNDGTECHLAAEMRKW